MVGKKANDTMVDVGYGVVYSGCKKQANDAMVDVGYGVVYNG